MARISLSRGSVLICCDEVAGHYASPAISLNTFTLLNLLDQLKECGFNPTGAIPSNLLQKCPLLDADKKKTRGEYDFRSDATSGLIAVRWNDNSIVNVASNHLGVQPSR